MLTRTITAVPLTVTLPLCVAGQIQFQETLGDTLPNYGASVQQTTDGGYILAGKSFCVSPEDLYLVKTDEMGSPVYTRYFGGSNDDAATSVRQTTDGGFIVTGYTEGFPLNGQDVFVVKTNAMLVQQWSRAIGGTGDQQGRCVRELAGGGSIIVGSTTGISAGGSDAYLVELDATGTLLWTRTFGGTGNEQGAAVQQTSDGGFILTGSTSPLGSGSTDILLIRTDAAGDTLWVRAIGGPGLDDGHAVVQCADGGFLVAGGTTSFGAGYSDVFLVKVDGSGALLWAATYGGSGDDEASAVVLADGGGFFVAGRTDFSIDAYLIRTDDAGTLLWSKTYGGVTVDLATGLDATTDGGAALLGISFSFSATNADLYFVKTDADGSSGCNETDPPTQYAPALPLVTPITSTVGSGGAATVLVPSYGSAGTAQPLCIATSIADVPGPAIGVELRPVPSFGAPEAVIVAPYAMSARIMIRDALGRHVMDRSVQLCGGEQVVPLAVVLSPGTYSFSLQHGNMHVSKIFVVR